MSSLLKKLKSDPVRPPWELPFVDIRKRGGAEEFFGMFGTKL